MSDGVCVASGCERRAYRHGLCHAHYGAYTIGLCDERGIPTTAATATISLDDEPEATGDDEEIEVEIQVDPDDARVLGIPQSVAMRATIPTARWLASLYALAPSPSLATATLLALSEAYRLDEED